MHILKNIFCLQTGTACHERYFVVENVYKEISLSFVSQSSLWYWPFDAHCRSSSGNSLNLLSLTIWTTVIVSDWCTSIVLMLGMRTLEHRRIEQSLIIFFKCFKENGPRYITNLFKPRVTPYNLRSSGLNVEQRPYNSRFFHGSYSYIISRIWNQLPPAAKNAANVPAFINHINTTNFGGCQCSSCLKWFLYRHVVFLSFFIIVFLTHIFRIFNGLIIFVFFNI